MAGALDSLEVGSAVVNADGRIVSCCKRFCEMAALPVEEIIGVRGRDLILQEDQTSAVWLMTQLWRTGESFTSLSRFRSATSSNRAYEGFVQRLEGAPTPMALAIVRPFNCRIKPAGNSEQAKAMAGYVVDMTLQMSEMASQASMPVTCDLLAAAADVGLREGGLGMIVQTPA